MKKEVECQVKIRVCLKLLTKPRLHSGIDYHTPNEYKKRVADQVVSTFSGEDHRRWTWLPVSLSVMNMKGGKYVAYTNYLFDHCHKFFSIW